jgi:hypothetical protein
MPHQATEPGNWDWRAAREAAEERPRGVVAVAVPSVERRQRPGTGAPVIVGREAREQEARRLAAQGPPPLDAKQQRERLEQVVLAGARRLHEEQEREDELRRLREFHRYSQPPR